MGNKIQSEAKKKKLTSSEMRKVSFHFSAMIWWSFDHFSAFG
jgi:hypothetical protein